ncbi:MAG: type IV secretion system DNA-binding domain-containing protein [Leadbetterella sp.]|nr:type IV secretion system DNA-binding domain-containing protein [Leadbetterella sp.]
MTQAEYYTNQFYQWEQRCRGWLLASNPVELEPPFAPYFRHGYHKPYLDEGKRHTWVSSFIDFFKDQKTYESNQESIDYNEILPYEYESKSELEAIQVKFPKERKIIPEKMKALLMMLSSFESNVSFEIIGNQKEIIVQFVSDSTDIKFIEINITAYFPECSIIRNDYYITKIVKEEISTATLDFGLFKEIYRPIQTPKNYSIDPLTSFIGILDQLENEEQACLQILFKGVLHNWGQSIISAVTLFDGSSFFEDDPIAPKVAIEKTASPIFTCAIRLVAQSRYTQTALEIMEKVAHAIVHGSTGQYNSLMPLIDEDYDFDSRMEDICLRQSHRLGMLLNADELACLLHFPSESIISKKLSSSIRKTIQAPSITLNKKFVLGENSHFGKSVKVTFAVEDRLKHTHIIGATGTGKSTLIANLIEQDIGQGYGVVLFDPHGDLIDDVISNIPDNRIEDVVLIDPSDADFSIGLNILQAHSEIEKEVLSGDLVASFRKFSTSWGDQMNTVFGNAILAILENPDSGSLHDLRRFLIESDFRNQYLKNVADPQVVYYWQKEYPLLRTNSIGSILTRLDTFLRPKSIRNMVVQKKGLDFEQLINSNKIVLFKLSQGLIGTENSFLLGSLFLSKIHQAILRRQQSSTRSPIFMYLDEFQNFITPSIKEMLSGIRKYNVGLTLSHQDLQQLQREDGELLNSVLGNINTRIVFRVGEPDAKKLQDGFEHFNVLDFQNLGRGQAIMRIEQPQFDCSMETFPIPKILKDERDKKINDVIEFTRKTYATSKDEIEKTFAQSLKINSVDFPKKNTEPVENQKTPIPKNEKIISEIPKQIISPINESINQETQKDLSVHRYLQTLVKKIAEQKGYVANIEMQVPNSMGQVDVLLTKDSTSIAVEISNTTDADWEMHNIKKCIEAKYNTIISLSGDPKQLDRIKKKCESEIENFNSYEILFFTPDAFFIYLDSKNILESPKNENVMKGYRVNVSYDSSSNEDMEKKRISVANVLLNSIKKRKN